MSEQHMMPEFYKAEWLLVLDALRTYTHESDINMKIAQMLICKIHKMVHEYYNEDNE